MPGRDELPSTLQRSDEKAQRTWIAAHDSAVESYGEGQRAHRVAFAAVKHTHEKVGDHWEPKDHSGPSDPAAESTGAAARDRGGSFGGVDVQGHTKKELLELADRVGADVTTKMKKAEIARAIDRANQRATAKAREE